MKKIFRFFRVLFLPKRSELAAALGSMPEPKRTVVRGSILLAGLLCLVLLSRLNEAFTTPVAVPGGTMVEGVIGVPRFINPVLAINETDRDLVGVIYSGLMKRLPNTEVVPDLAEKVTVSEDGRTYTFTLREEARFHDGKKVTAEDVRYTIAQIQDPAIQSPRQANWNGVMVSVIDEKTIAMTLPRAYSAFLETASVGVLPSHLWRDTTPETFHFLKLNTEPVGSGPFRFVSMERKRDGIPVSYRLKRFKRYALGAPFIKRFSLKIYGNQHELEKALESGEIRQAAGVSQETVSGLRNQNLTVHQSTLPRVFGLFFNSARKDFFANRELVAVLESLLNKEEIIAQSLAGAAERADGPVPFEPIRTKGGSSPETKEEVAAKFKRLGWVLDQEGFLKKEKGDATLSFSLATADAPELIRVGEAVRDQLGRYGIAVDLQVFDLGSLTQDIIKPRSFDALLFGQAVEHERDLYAFWHSSERLYPGLNVTNYANREVDEALERILTTSDRTVINENLQKVESLIRQDRPAIFLYLPHFLYLSPEEMKGVELAHIRNASDRFLGVFQWFMETEPVWNIFIKK